jgi:hypothetical protein
MAAFYVYADFVAKDQTKIHRAECPYCRHGSGTQPNVSDENRKWVPFEHLWDAQSYLVSQGFDSERFCKHCRPNEA